MIGIPRALYYFHYQPLWQHFFQELGLEVVFSPPTNRQVLEWGLAACVDGACLPIKAYVGHCQALARQGLKLLFVPQIISLFKREFICPNFMGLPDSLRQYLPSSVRLLTPALDSRQGPKAIVRAYWRLGQEFAPFFVVKRAWAQALQEQKRKEARQLQARPQFSKNGLNILLLGPRYLTDDHFLNGNLVAKLNGLGAQVLKTSHVSHKLSLQASSVLEKRLFWTGGRRSLGALEFFLASLDGVICIAPFGCGAESLLGALMDHRLKQSSLAKLGLNFDEHTSEVGLLTRLEAFCDLLERKKGL